MFSKEVTRFYITQYAYVVLTAFLALLLEFTPTRVSQFFEGDLTLSHTCGNTVSTPMIFIYYLTITVVLILFVYVFVKKTERSSFIHFILIISSRVLSSILLFGNCLKILVGKPRPCFFDMCQYPKKDLFYGEIGRVGDISKCAAPKHTIFDSMRSFPSGHSLVSSAAFTLFSLLAKSILYHSTKWNSSFINRLYHISITAVFCSSTILSVTRIMDYMHFADDVIAGLVLGGVLTIITNNSVKASYCKMSTEINDPTGELNSLDIISV